MNIAGINYFDIVNGPGIRVSLFVSGCNNHCNGCFNQNYQDFNCGIPYSDDLAESIKSKLQHKDFSGLSLLGGDPLWQDEDGIKQLIDLCKFTHSLNKTVWIWSGFTWDEIFDESFIVTDLKQTLIASCDVFIDGRFDLELKKLGLIWKGSTNQRIIDVNKSLAKKEVVLFSN